MKYIKNGNNISKIPVIFIHGFLKDGNDWNITKKTNINIQKNVSKKRVTINISFDIIDYLLPFHKVCIKIYKILLLNNINNAIFVAHSIGGIYAKLFSTLYPNFIHSLLLIDSSEINDNFLQELIFSLKNEKNIIIANMYINMINNFTLLPDIHYIKHINKNINIFSLINIIKNEFNLKKYINKFFDNSIIKYNSYINDTFTYYKTLMCENFEKNFIIFYDVSHMIHHKKFLYIIDLIDKI